MDEKSLREQLSAPNRTHIREAVHHQRAIEYLRDYPTPDEVVEAAYRTRDVIHRLRETLRLRKAQLD